MTSIYPNTGGFMLLSELLLFKHKHNNFLNNISTHKKLINPLIGKK